MKDSLKYNPRTYTLSAIIIGYLLIGDYSALEQNSIGNWFMTVGQILECNSAIQQQIEKIFQGNAYNINSKQYKKTGNPYMNNKPLLDILNESDIDLNNIKCVLNNILDKINKLEKKDH